MIDCSMKSVLRLCLLFLAHRLSDSLCSQKNKNKQQKKKKKRKKLPCKNVRTQLLPPCICKFTTPLLLFHMRTAPPTLASACPRPLHVCCDRVVRVASLDKLMRIDRRKREGRREKRENRVRPPSAHRQCHTAVLVGRQACMLQPSVSSHALRGRLLSQIRHAYMHAECHTINTTEERTICMPCRVPRIPRRNATLRTIKDNHTSV